MRAPSVLGGGVSLMLATANLCIGLLVKREFKNGPIGYMPTIKIISIGNIQKISFKRYRIWDIR